MSNFSLTICLRVYPGSSRTPIITSNKLKTFLICLESLLMSCDKHNVKIIYLLDACPLNFDNNIKSLSNKYNINFDILNVNLQNNAQTFKVQYDILKSCDSDIVGFVEDDYYFEKEAIPTVFRLFNRYPLDFFTLYNTSDYYNNPLHLYKNKNEKIGEIFCSEVASTTLTFFTAKSNLKKYFKNFESYWKRDNNDYTIWLSITKKCISLLLFQYIKSGKLKYLKYIIKIIINYKLLLNERAKLRVTKPGLAVHLDKRGFSTDHFINNEMIFSLNNKYDEK